MSPRKPTNPPAIPKRSNTPPRKMPMKAPAVPPREPSVKSPTRQIPSISSPTRQLPSVTSPPKKQITGTTEGVASVIIEQFQIFPWFSQEWNSLSPEQQNTCKSNLCEHWM